MNIDRINVGGNLYDVCDTNARAMISDEYNSATQYNAGDYCIWENTLKKANKSTTGTYDHTAWDDTNIGEVVGELNQKIPTTMTWNAITGKPSFLSVNYVDVTINGGNGSGNINISQYTSGYSAVVPVLINTTTGNWDINVGIQGNLLIAAGSGVAEGYQVMVRLYRFK